MARIEIKHLRTLVALRDCGSLVDAAQQVHLTQSALSHQLKELEDRLNQPVVIRKSKPLKFTETGSRLLQLADTVLPAVEQTEQDISMLALGKQGRLHIAIECHSCFDWLMPTLDEYREHWPDVEIDLISGFNFDPLPALARAELDLVITSDPQSLSGVRYIPLFQYECLLCVAKDHPLAKKELITPQDLSNETLIIYPVEQARLDIFKYFLLPANVLPKVTRSAELTIMIIQLVASGRGVCALPNWGIVDYLEKGYVLARSLGESGVWSTLYAAVREEQADAPYIEEFINTARSCSQQTLKGIQPPE
ncbi:LysR family transcriptional regulator [Ketobacter sp. MCCC 1A13808]|uniref:LysR family transcriptional regulator n=1 Tax=Ketobacter sp. MCCC 1A13808 TaxID=2602738 RepID=UPI000F24063A|nr:LysR family transcriptional regulator [Ketobacter sp. MCCC 1A13808]MVF10834.1 LysR family transcriptional regulator [Ketobacter sp. MCCC 1A13808]RLP56234.1 MAG: LysR family transcriptional regulator [Ketobacter sp.]